MKKITEKQQKIVEENLPLVGYIAKKFNPKDRHEYDDLVQQGVLALMDAASKFNSSRGKFSTLAHICIYREIKRYIEKNHRVVLYKDSVKADFHDEKRSDSPNNIEENYSDSLSPIEKNIVNLKMDGFSCSAIERKFGKKRNWASKILKRALEKIKEHL